jgi:hypothetical protein
MKSIFTLGLLLVALVGAEGLKAGELLGVDIVPALSRGSEPEIFVSGEPHHRLHVVVSNLSDSPQRVYEDWNSWGYDSLSFEAITGEGKKVQLKKKPRDWTKNFASTYTIAARGHYVIPVQLSTNEWENAELISSPEVQPIKLKAIFEIPKPDTNTYQVWVGRVESVTRTVKVEKMGR